MKVQIIIVPNPTDNFNKLDESYINQLLENPGQSHKSYYLKLKKNSVACSPQANYTDRAAAAC
jgi:hypothetical protein